MVPRRKALADRTYVDGEDYRLGVIEERSANSHNHYFAMIYESWLNLPEAEADRFPTPEHLRKWAVIQAGYYINSDFACGSNAEAVRLAAYIKGIDDYSVVVVKGSVVMRLIAKSQSMKTMDKQEFQDSKTKVLEIVSGLIGVTPGQIERVGA